MRTFAFALMVAAMATPAHAADPVLLHAAGSLRTSLTEVAAGFEKASGLKVQMKFGASGLLKDEIAGGAKAEVFASANMEHPKALAAAGKSGPVVLFARDQMCALFRPGLTVTTAALLDRILDPEVKLGTSTPAADPSGDYAWEIFRKAERLKPGAFAALEKKAIKLVGFAGAPAASAGRSVYAMLVSEGKADVFLTYCTNVMDAQREVPALQMVRLPDALAVAADYGLTVMDGASANASRFAMYILSVEGQRVLARFGFAAPALPQ